MESERNAPHPDERRRGRAHPVAPRRGLEIGGRLSLELEGERPIDVVGHGSRVRVEIGAFGARARPTLRLVRSSVVLARRLSRVLDERTLTLAITRDGTLLAELGSGVRGGPFTRLLGLSRVRVYRKKA